MKNITLMLITVAIVASLTMTTSGQPDYAKKEKKTCDYCHSVNKGGGPRGFRGMYYGAHKLTFKSFVEKTEAGKAGVKVGAMGVKTKPTKPYTGK
jgi:hypothetical protein